MSKELTIYIPAYDETKKVNACIESIRCFGTDVEVEVVLVVNAKDNSLIDWAGQQEDISFVSTDNDNEPWGCVFSQVMEAIPPKENMMILSPEMMITPGALSVMLDVINSNKDIGAVGCISNDLSFGIQLTERDLKDYEDAVNYSVSLGKIDEEVRFALAVNHMAVIFKTDIVIEVGGFDDKMGALKSASDDIQLRMMAKGKKNAIAKKAVLYSMSDNEYPNPYEEGDKEQLRLKWGMHYFNLVPGMHLVSMIDEKEDAHINVLEVGCDCGATLYEIGQHYKNGKMYGLEINEAAAKIASFHSEVISGNIESEDLKYEKDFFDYIIFGDVLEHLHDPLKTIKYIKGFLKPGGYIVANIPNVMHVSVMKQLLMGMFTYTDMGLLDRTHIHLFTYFEILDMFKKADMEIKDVFNTFVDISDMDKKLINELIRIAGNPNVKPFMYESFQYLVKAQKKK